MKAAVDSGEYATAGEIVREALRQWQAGRHMKEEEIRLVRKPIEDGRDSGSAGEVDFNALKAEARLAHVRFSLKRAYLSFSTALPWGRWQSRSD